MFIDTTGLANIASNFDDVYETAYVDLSRSFYKKLTESVVRSSQEARQIILQATGPGEVDNVLAGTTGTGEFTLTPGNYILMCNLPGHFAAGMVATLTVE